MARKKWTKEKDALLRRLYAESGMEALREALPGFTAAAISQRASALGLGKSRAYHKRAQREAGLRVSAYMRAIRTHVWTPERDAILRRLYADNGMEALREALPGFADHRIYNRAYALGLKKSRAHQERMNRENGRRLTVQGAAHRFEPGQEPHNKGQSFCAPGSEKGWFKNGHLPHNTKEDGHIALRSCGYYWIRLSLRRWKELHRYIYEQYHGVKLKRSDVVVFKDGDRANFDIANLECITRAENMRRNTIHRYPEEVKRAIRAVNKLNKIIKDHEK